MVTKIKRRRARVTAESMQALLSVDTHAVRARVHRFIAEQGSRGATCDEVEIALGMVHQTASARFTELKDAGRIMHAGIRRPTRSGRMAGVYRVPD